MLVETGQQGVDLLLQSGPGYGDERLFDVVPQLSGLASGIEATARNRLDVSLHRAAWRPWRPRAQERRHQRAARTCDTQGHQRPGAELRAPVGCRLHPSLQFFQVRAEPLAGAVDVRRYFVDGFSHSRFSFSAATVRSGTGVIRLNRRTPAITSPAPTAAITAPTSSNDAHMGITVASP